VPGHTTAITTNLPYLGLSTNEKFAMSATVTASTTTTLLPAYQHPSALYPVVEDITEMEYGCCPCDQENSILGRFPLQDIAFSLSPSQKTTRNPRIVRNIGVNILPPPPLPPHYTSDGTVVNLPSMTKSQY
jgi:hypothetical protein